MQAQKRSLTISTVLFWMLCLAFANTIKALTIEKPAQDSVKITFDRNEGSGAFDRILKEYGPHIKGLVQLQLAYPNSKLTVRSNADGVRYRLTHNEKNTLKSVERAVTGNDLLDTLGADMHRVTPVPLTNESDTGMAFRYVVITFIPEEPQQVPAPPPPSVQPKTPNTCEPSAHGALVRSENRPDLQLLVGAGYAWTPFGGTPSAVGALSYHRWLYVEAHGSHSLGNEQWSHQGASYETHVRSAGVNIIAYPFGRVPVGLLVGFADTYRINDATGEYVQRYLSPTYGVRGRIPLDANGFWELSLSATAQPGTRSTIGTQLVDHITYGRVAGYVTYTFGGTK